jgi:hypothetical protein
MADTQSSLPVRTIANGDVLVGVVDTSDARINPATEGGNLATLAAVDFAKESGGNLASIAGHATTLAAVDFAKESGGNLAATATNTGSINTKLPASLGAKNSSGSLSVTVATDQTPMPVYVTTSVPSAPVVDFKTDAGVVTNNASTHTYSPATKFVLNNVQASGSGRIKVEVKVGPTGSETTRWVGFNSASEPNVYFDASDYSIPGADTTGWSVVVIVTNLEVSKPQDLYSTIVGNL